MFLVLWISPVTKLRHWLGPYEEKDTAIYSTVMRDHSIKFKWILVDENSDISRISVMDGLNS
jgi:hypothetical protein